MSDKQKELSELRAQRHALDDRIGALLLELHPKCKHGIHVGYPTTLSGCPGGSFGIMCMECHCEEQGIPYPFRVPCFDENGKQL